MLNRRAIPVKLAMAVGIPVLAAVLFALLAVRTLDSVRVGGAKYQQIEESSELVADILPPPAFGVESYLTVQQLADVTSPEVFESLKARLIQFEADYEAAQSKWRDRLEGSSSDSDGTISLLLTEQSANPAQEFFTVARNEFLPAVELSLTTGDLAPAREIMYTKLEPLFEQHRTKIVELVPLALQKQASLEKSAEDEANSGFLVLALTLAGLMLAAITLAAVVARAIVRPIFQLSHAANEVATTLTEANLDEETPELEPLELNSSPELNVAADSFNTMIGTTLDLVDRQARMRRNLGEIFQNLGRRNHGLLNRSLQVITQLERDETNPETLEQLFRLDHLATRMRRNAENLLILAGSQSARTVERKSSVADITRSALSEIEEYTRVDRPDLEPIAIKAGAVADVTHLVAELLENATSFSPPGAKVRVHGAFVDDGYVITIVDEGLGMRSDALDEANRRIEKLARLDLTPTRTLGLYVVGRLADRHGIKVRLLEGSLRGTVAKVFIPKSLLEEISDSAGDTAARNSEMQPAVAAKTAPDRRNNEPARSGKKQRGDRGGNTADATEPPAVEIAEPATAKQVVSSPTASAALRPAGEERNGMRRRVRGAQMPETELEGLGSIDAGPVASAETVERDRNNLSSFQAEVQRGEREGRAAKDQEK